MSDPPTHAPPKACPRALPTRALVRECRLTVVDGGGDGAVHPLGGERTVVGAHPSADIVLADAAMSKFHCEIRIADGTPRVRDLGSTNGTFVDGVPVARRAAAPRRDADARPHPAALRHRPAPRRDPAVAARALRPPRRPLGADARRLRAARARRRQPTPRCSCKARPAPARSSPPSRSTSASARARRAVRRRRLRRAAAEPDRGELFGHERGAFTGADRAARRRLRGAPTAARSSSTRSASCRSTCSRSSCARSSAREVRRVGATQAPARRRARRRGDQSRSRAEVNARPLPRRSLLPPRRPRGDAAAAARAHAATCRCSSTASSAISARATCRRPPRCARASSCPSSCATRWPGNVRELRNYVESWLVQRRARAVAVVVVGRAGDRRDAAAARGARSLGALGRAALSRAAACAEHGNNVSAAARAAGIDRVHLHRLLSRAGLR